MILGDNGAAFFAAGIAFRVKSTATSKGAKDTIRAGAGKNIVMGGAGGDIITAGTGSSTILGDNGLALFSSLGVAQVVQTIAPEDFGDDEITVEEGSHILMGGSGADKINANLLTATIGNNVVVGDDGVANFEGGALVALVSENTTYDGIDIIKVGNGFNTVFGGGAGDDIDVKDGTSVVFGDSGYARFLNNKATVAFSLQPATGGADKIRAGKGNAVIFGGAAGDDIASGDGNSTLFGGRTARPSSSTGW